MVHWSGLGVVLLCHGDTRRYEDFDTVFNGRKNVTRTDLTLDVILNAVDGIEPDPGLLLFITTNRIEKVDAAIGGPSNGRNSTGSTRPGRIDKSVFVGPPDAAGRYKIALKVTQDPASAQTVASRTAGCSGAVVKDRAQALALAGRAVYERNYTEAAVVAQYCAFFERIAA